MRKISSPDSMGINSSDPNAKAYGVSPVGCFGVMRYAQSAIGSSSTYLPLANVSLFFK